MAEEGTQAATVENNPGALSSSQPSDGQAFPAPEGRPLPAEQNPGNDGGKAEEEIPAEFNFTQAFRDSKQVYDPRRAGEFSEVLKNAGLKDNAVANKLAAHVLSGEKQLQRDLFMEALQEYGGTPENPGPRFAGAQAKAGRAVEALEAKIPGFRAALAKSPLDYDVRVLKALALFGDFVSEDGNFSGGSSKGLSSMADMYFKKSD